MAPDGLNAILIQRIEVSPGLVILRVAHRCACTYEWEHHVRLGRRAGLPPEQIELVVTMTSELVTNVLRHTASEPEVTLRTDDHVLVVEVHDLDQLELATELLTRCEDCAVPTMDRQRHTVSLPVEDDTGIAARAISILAEGEVDIADFHLERPSLDDVFLSLTSSGTLPAGSDTSTATEDR